jgi:hypothetical protein
MFFSIPDIIGLVFACNLIVLLLTLQELRKEGESLETFTSGDWFCFMYYLILGFPYVTVMALIDFLIKPIVKYLIKER